MWSHWNGCMPLFWHMKEVINQTEIKIRHPLLLFTLLCYNSNLRRCVKIIKYVRNSHINNSMQQCMMMRTCNGFLTAYLKKLYFSRLKHTRFWNLMRGIIRPKIVDKFSGDHKLCKNSTYAFKYLYIHSFFFRAIQMHVILLLQSWIYQVSCTRKL